VGAVFGVVRMLSKIDKQGFGLVFGAKRGQSAGSHLGKAFL
jgi:hypothetical protein